MSFPVKQSVLHPNFREILISTESFILDEFSNLGRFFLYQNARRNFFLFQ